MTEFLVVYLPWVLSALTVYSMWLAGEMSRHAWLVGLVNQTLWLLWITLSGMWGLLPGAVAIAFVFLRNYIKWSR